MTTLREAISNSRLEGYRRSAKESDHKCLERYVWNVALSESLYPTLQYLEVALRNSIHGAATNHFNSDFWFDNPAVISNSKTLRIVSSAKGTLSKAYKPIESDRVVAELHFGFWSALFYSEYEKKLWRQIIKEVFPNAPRRARQRSIVGPKIDRAKKLRNRISHHEPIWHWNDLEDQHGEIVEVIGWISQPLRELAELCDRFPEVRNQGISINREALKKLKL